MTHFTPRLWQGATRWTGRSRTMITAGLNKLNRPAIGRGMIEGTLLAFGPPPAARTEFESVGFVGPAASADPWRPLVGSLESRDDEDAMLLRILEALEPSADAFDPQDVFEAFASGAGSAS